MAVKALNSTPLPILPEVQTPSPVPPWGEPVPACNISTCLPSLRWSLPTTLGLPRHQVHPPITLAWTSSRLRYLSKAKATWRLKEFLRLSHAGLQTPH